MFIISFIFEKITQINCINMHLRRINEEWRKSVDRTNKRSIALIFFADKNKPVTSFSYHIKEAWINLCVLWCIFFQNMEGMFLWYTSWKLVFLRNYLTKSIAVFCKGQVINYSVITWNYILISFYTLKVIDAESLIVIFFWDIRYTAYRITIKHRSTYAYWAVL